MLWTRNAVKSCRATIRVYAIQRKSHREEGVIFTRKGMENATEET